MSAWSGFCIEDELDLNAQLLFRMNGTPLSTVFSSKLWSAIYGFNWTYIYDVVSLSNVQALYTFVYISAFGDLILIFHVPLRSSSSVDQTWLAKIMRHT